MRKPIKKYHCVAFIPVKTTSRRVPGKNFRNLGGKPLFEHVLQAALNSKVEAVFVDTDSKEVKARAGKIGAYTIDRPQHLAGDDANGNDLLLYEANLIHADIYVQLFVTSPFLGSQTINKALEILEEHSEYDSVFTVNRIYSWFWFAEKPINYNPQVLPRSQDAQPVVRETTGLYAIRRNPLLERKCRIGDAPYMLEIGGIEGIDIDNELDFQIAELIMRNNLGDKKL
ncbi:MAG: acylneuraminate cytidylyltransferase family protein [Candidatus Omnitrophota bacterium]|nr:MAG: acylneuraminate cytidylyltransferase family protein [Candidatus Omnitrophota bacterium]